MGAPTRPTPAGQRSIDPFHPERVDGKKLTAVTLLTAGGLTGTYLSLVKPWWSGQKQGFHVKYDWWENRWLEVDKIGHFYANIQIVRGTARLFEYAGVSRKWALGIGFFNSTALYTAFELTDAGFADWGFSVPDYVANIIGAAYPIAQELWKPLRQIHFKISYWPSRYYKSDRYADTPGFQRFDRYTYPVGDYDGMTYWISAPLRPILPGSLARKCPAWLNVALGYGAANLPQDNPAVKFRQYYLALDLNTQALPGQNPFWREAQSILQAIHFPAPAIGWSEQGWRFFLVYF